MEILLIDDDQDGLEELNKLLRNNGFATRQFISSKEAVKAYRSGNFDVVITDLKMPRMNGIEVLETVRASNPESYVLIITAFDDPENRRAALDKGAYGFFGKPLNIKKLLSTLSEIENKLRRKKGAANEE